MAKVLYSEAESEAAKEVAESAIEAYTEMAEVEAEAAALADQAGEEIAEAMKEASREKTGTIKAGANNKAAETLQKAKDVEASVKEHKTETIFETSYGRQISQEAIADRIPEGADAAYVKLEENKIYWVKGTETGSVDIW